MASVSSIWEINAIALIIILFQKKYNRVKLLACYQKLFPISYQVNKAKIQYEMKDIKPMQIKKIIISILSFCIPSLLFSMELGEKAYKTFSVNNKEVNKWVFFKSIEKYDENGQLITLEQIDNDKVYEVKYEYDNNGNIIHKKENTGFEIWNNYDDENHIIYSKDNKNIETWYEYDAKNKNLLHKQDSQNNQTWYEYDFFDNLIHIKESSGNKYWYKYDENGNKLSAYCNSGIETTYEYDKNGFLIYEKEEGNDGEKINEWWYAYTKNGKLSKRMIRRYIPTDLYEYDKKGNLIYEKNYNDYEILCEIDYWDNGKIKEKRSFKTF